MKDHCQKLDNLENYRTILNQVNISQIVIKEITYTQMKASDAHLYTTKHFTKTNVFEQMYWALSDSEEQSSLLEKLKTFFTTIFNETQLSTNATFQGSTIQNSMITINSSVKTDQISASLIETDGNKRKLDKLKDPYEKFKEELYQQLEKIVLCSLREVLLDRFEFKIDNQRYNEDNIQLDIIISSKLDAEGDQNNCVPTISITMHLDEEGNTESDLDGPKTSKLKAKMENNRIEIKMPGNSKIKSIKKVCREKLQIQVNKRPSVGEDSEFNIRIYDEKTEKEYNVPISLKNYSEYNLHFAMKYSGVEKKVNVVAS